MLNDTNIGLTFVVAQYLIIVFDAILTGRQISQKLQCLYGNRVQIAFRKIRDFFIIQANRNFLY